MQNNFNDIIELLNLNLFKKAEKEARLLIKKDGDNLDLLNIFCAILLKQNKFEESLLHFEKIIKKQKENHSTFNNYGSAFMGLGRYEDAKKCLIKAINLKEDYFQAYNNLGACHSKLGEYEKAIDAYNQSLKIKDDYPETYNNLGLTYQKIERYDLSITAFNNAIKLNNFYAEAYNNLGLSYEFKNQISNAFINFNKALDLKEDFNAAMIHLGDLYSKNNQSEKALHYYNRSFKINPDTNCLIGKIIMEKMKMFDHKNLDYFIDLLERKIKEKKNPISPGVFLLINDNIKKHEKVLKMQKYGFKDIQISKFQKKEKNLDRKIKVAYFSSDFKEHAVSYLVEDLLKFHDKNDFEVYGFYLDDVTDEVCARLSKYFNNFFYIKDKSIKEIISICKKIELDIAIDLNGHTEGRRTEIFAHKIAPIQINFLGYPGTSGFEFFDYIVADKILIPENYERYYSEKIIYMPNSYQINSQLDIINSFSKKKYNISSDAFIFGSFNNIKKVTPDIFRSWATILKRTQNSILWLLEDDDIIINNIKLETKKINLSEDKIIFAKKLPKISHLQRYFGVDLFLDTYPYGSHTTGSDCLRCATPIITFCGEMFQSRVTASLLKSLNINELITYNLKDYENLAINLANDRKKLNFLREKIKINLKTATLFDGKLYTKNFETALKKAYQKFNSNSPTENIFV